jgi:hypothetical protein
MKEFLKLWLKLNMTIWHWYQHTSTEEKDEVAKEEFDSSVQKVHDAVPDYKLKTVLGDLNTNIGKKSYLYPTCAGHSLHNKTNVKFCTGKRFSCDGNILST